MALILLAEEETSTIDHVRSVLASQGWLVKTVKSRAQALRAASEFAPQLVLLNDELIGIEDLVRTFSRRNGGPGVILLSNEEESPADRDGVEAVLTKPLQTEDLIAIIRDKLSIAVDKKTAADDGGDIRILSTEEIFGGFLDDILDKAEQVEAAAPEDEMAEEEAAAVTTRKEAVEPEEVSAAVAAQDLADFSDLEELAQQAVPALVDAVEAQARQSGEPQEELDVAQLLRGVAFSPPPPVAQSVPPVDEIDEELEARLSDTLAGVLAASLGAATTAEGAATDADADDEVESLLSRALGDLDVGRAKVRSESRSAAPRPPSIETAARVSAPEPDKVAEEPAEQEAEEEVSVDLVTEEVEAEPEPQPRPAPSPKPAIEFGEYTLEERIGLGGMAEVWKAKRKGVEGFEKRVAIKKILPQPAENQDFVDMFIDEAKLAAQLNHKNITHIYDLGKVDDDYFIAMEYVEGQNLRQLLDAARKRNKPLPTGLALYIASCIAEALEYAHRSKDFNNANLGLVHRDVSPQNVLISHAGDIKLCDFGIAKAVSKISTTQMGALKGKLQYMSPEQAWGRSIDPRSDIFSCGTLLFEMLAGERLFTGESELSVLEAVRECDSAERVIRDPVIPSPIKGLLLKALAKEPEDRFESAGELLEGLEKLLAELDPTPGEREMSSFIRDLLDLPESSPSQAEPPTPATAPEPLAEEAAEAAEIAELAADPAALLLQEVTATDEDEESVEEEGERKPAFLRWLWRLLPVVAALAIGGYLIADRMGPVRAPRSSSTSPAPRIVEAEAFRPEAVEASLLPAGAVTAEGEAAIQDGTVLAPPTDEPQATPRPAEVQQPEASPTTGEAVAAAVDDNASQTESTTIEPSDTEAADNAQLRSTDPEVERRVEEDLQRVQELISAREFSADEEVGGEAVNDEAVQAPGGSAPLVEETDAPSATQDPITEPEDPAELMTATEDDGVEESPAIAAEGGEPPETPATALESEVPASSPDLPIAPPADESQATQPGDLVEPGLGVVEPQVLSFRPPAYSGAARRVGVTGTVRVAVLVDENGQVLEARLVEGLRQKVGLEEQTLQAARSAAFRPATKDGVPVRMWHELAVQFQP